MTFYRQIVIGLCLAVAQTCAEPDFDPSNIDPSKIDLRTGMNMNVLMSRVQFSTLIGLTILMSVVMTALIMMVTMEYFWGKNGRLTQHNRKTVQSQSHDNASLA